MARVTVEDCVDKVPNRFELVMLAVPSCARDFRRWLRSPLIATTTRTPSYRLREIADETQSADELRERLIERRTRPRSRWTSRKKMQMALLMGAESDKPADDDMSEEKLLRALMEAQERQ